MKDAFIARSGAVGQKNWTLEWLNARSYKSSGPEGGLVNGENDLGLAARLYSLCLRVLRQICRQEQYNSSSRNSISKPKEELGKLYLWGQAFRDGKLDRALEYSDEVRGNVLELLGHIGRLLLREVWPSSISKLESSSSQKPIQELKYLVEQTRAITSSEDIRAVGDAGFEDGGSDTDQDDISEDDDTDDFLEELGLYTRWLTQLGPIMEQNLIHAENARLQVSRPTIVPFSASGPAATYISLVREKYRFAQNQLVERLGEANWQRHLGVRNRMEASVDVHEELAIAKSVFRPYSAFHDSGIGTSVPAQTQYAPSHTSFQSSNAEGERNSLRVPATPVEVYERKPFQCFLCKSMLSNIKTRVDWKMHIFSDLQPYICTFTECRDELAQFPSRAAWAEHEFSKHRIMRLWACPECPKDFPDVSSWENHLQERHRFSFSGPNLQIAKNMALKTEARRIENDECPLCRIIVGKPRRGFVKHVGRHLEEIALMALPRNGDEDTEEGSTSTDRTSLKQGNTRPTQPGVAPAAQMVAPNNSQNPIQHFTAETPNSSIPVLPPPTIQEVNTARAQLPEHMKTASDEQVRVMISNKRRHDYLNKAMLRWEQEANGQHAQSGGGLYLKPPIYNSKGKVPFDSDVAPMRATGRTDLENARDRNQFSIAQAPLENEAVNEISELSRHPSPPLPPPTLSNYPTPTMSKGRFQSADQPTLEKDQHHQLTQDRERGNILFVRAEQLAASQRSGRKVFDLQHGLPLSAAKMKASIHEADHQRNQLQVHKDANAYMESSKNSGGSPDPNPKNLCGRAAAQGRCHSCNRAETPEWRRGSDGARTLCNACGLQSTASVPPTPASEPEKPPTPTPATPVIPQPLTPMPEIPVTPQHSASFAPSKADSQGPANMMSGMASAAPGQLAPQQQDTAMSEFIGGGVNEQYTMPFYSDLNSSDILENFDFESFLQKTDGTDFNSDPSIFEDGGEIDFGGGS